MVPSDTRVVNKQLENFCCKNLCHKLSDRQYIVEYQYKHSRLLLRLQSICCSVQRTQVGFRFNLRSPHTMSKMSLIQSDNTLSTQFAKGSYQAIDCSHKAPFLMFSKEVNHTNELRILFDFIAQTSFTKKYKKVQKISKRFLKRFWKYPIPWIALRGQNPFGLV